nr:lipocalin family protein [Sphingobacterium sp. E70]
MARLDFRWERGLSQVSAEYSKNKNGTIRVNNQGYSEEKEQWKQSIGRAKFVNGPHEGALKVSFSVPFTMAIIL